MTQENVFPVSRSQLFVEHCLQLVRQKLPVVNAVLERYGDLTIADYLQTLVPPAVPSHQPRDDLLEVVYHYVAPLLGEPIARRVVRDLEQTPLVLTANHHGVEYFAQTFQARLIFALDALSGQTSRTTVPVFACGNIPLDNPLYPRGGIIYDVSVSRAGISPQKIPIFPDRLKRRIVSAVNAFDCTMVKRAIFQLNRMAKEGQISPSLAASLHEIFQDHYCADSVMSQPTYSQQSVLLNSRLWKRLFPQLDPIPEMVYLELEKVSSMLLERDLTAPTSLASLILFDPVLRDHILTELDGITGCWKRSLRERQFPSTSVPVRERTRPLESWGTLFFWGLDDAGRKFSLNLNSNKSGDLILTGIDDSGAVMMLPYTPGTLIKAIQEKKLLPSVFLCFIILLFARGLACVGGYFQGEYLPKMKQGISRALQKTQHYPELIQHIQQAPTHYYLDSMLTVMTLSQERGLFPAGPVEIIATGGLSHNDIEKMLSLTLREAHLADMLETIPDVVSPKHLPSHWRQQVADECSTLLGGKIVIK